MGNILFKSVGMVRLRMLFVKKIELNFIWPKPPSGTEEGASSTLSKNKDRATILF